MQQNEHTSSRFDAELGEVRELVIQMGILAESQVRHVIDMLGNADAELADAVIFGDRRVNALELKIDEECDRMVALRQPAAVDMRTVMAVVKIVTDLERIGDEAKSIAHTAQRHLAGGHAGVLQSFEVRRSAENALTMLQKSLDNFSRLDLDSAMQLIRANYASDKAFGFIVRPLVMEMMADPGAVAVGLDLMVISRAIERIAEHAINISEHVVYLIKGQDVRHIPLEEIERRISQ